MLAASQRGRQGVPSADAAGAGGASCCAAPSRSQLQAAGVVSAAFTGAGRAVRVSTLAAMGASVSRAEGPAPLPVGVPPTAAPLLQKVTPKVRTV